ncbi:ABC transporter permease [Paenibacillus thiaminolyticus]|uniref:FtsX-like permease family protein n=1 Tax=Paenibacillus thiaminolyticus TaxID=49283 RepID=UPI003D2BD489
MNFRQFAYNNIVRNKRTYIAHFLSSAFSVMIFFTYALLLFHPDLQGQLRSTSLTMSMLGTMGMRISQIMIFVFSFIYLFYSVSAFLKNRKKEFGLLLVLGISRRQLRQLIFIENMIIGTAAIVTGIAVGLIFAKLTLLICAKMLVIYEGLRFYIPLQAILMTAGAFLLLFLLIALFTSRIRKTEQLVELLKSEDKPKPEPKASLWLSLLAAVLIGLGYFCVMVFAVERVFSFVLLFGGVALVVAGTYWLFTQLSVYAIRALKKRERLYFHKTNLLTLSELAYRMKDNAVMFFMVAVISAVAFTGIGTSMSIGDPGLQEMKNPYAFTYISSQGNDREQEHLTAIKKRLSEANFTYRMGRVAPWYSDNGLLIMKLSEYNGLAAALGYEAETLGDEEGMLVPTSVNLQTQYKNASAEDYGPVDIVEGDWTADFRIAKLGTHIVYPEYSMLLVVSDASFGRIPGVDDSPVTYFLFVVDHWEKSKAVSQQLLDQIEKEAEQQQDGKFMLHAHIFDWLQMKQGNGLLLIVSVLVGVVFFTFAASLLYFRLYADLDRDERQYEMIAKVGLSRKELKKMVTRQLLLMFFLPIFVAVIHSSVAFTALQQIVSFPVASSAVVIFISFLTMQTLYFFVVRWRYLNHLYGKIK